MFSRFHVEIRKDFFRNKNLPFEKYKEIGEKHLQGQSYACRKLFHNFIVDGALSEERLESGFYPDVDADIFLSHSSLDRDVVHALAGWLVSEFGLRCFLNSNVWDQSEQIIEHLEAGYERTAGMGFVFNPTIILCKYLGHL